MKNFQGLYHFTPDPLMGRGHFAPWRHGKDRRFLCMFLHMKERQVHSTRGSGAVPVLGLQRGVGSFTVSLLSHLALSFSVHLICRVHISIQAS